MTQSHKALKMLFVRAKHMIPVSLACRDVRFAQELSCIPEVEPAILPTIEAIHIFHTYINTGMHACMHAWKHDTTLHLVSVLWKFLNCFGHTYYT